MSVEGEIICPLCLEEMDVTDQQLKPCKCGYEICVWCWHHIIGTAEKDGMEGICPACRSPYDKEKILGKAISSERLEELKAEKRQKPEKSKSKVLEMRAHLTSCRVIRRNLVYLAGLPVNIADKKILQKKDFLGQYGKVLNVVMTKADTGNQRLSTSSHSVFVTFSKDEEALRCIQALNGFIFDGRPLRASFGTTKYCGAWLKNMPCENPNCVYLHDVGQQEDICTKEDVIPVCASKIRQSCVTTFDNMQRCSGRFFPPPIQSSSSNAARCRTILDPMLHHPVDYDRNINRDGNHVKYGTPFNEASRLKVSSMISSSTSIPTIQGDGRNINQDGNHVKYDTTFNEASGLKASSMISSSTSIPTIQGEQVNKPTMGNHFPCSSGWVLGVFSSSNLWQKHGPLSSEHNGPKVGMDSVVKSCVDESSYIHQRTSKQCCADYRLVCQQPIYMYKDVIQCSSIGDTGASLLHSVCNSMDFHSEGNIVHRGQNVTCKSKDSYVSFLEALSPGLESPGPTSQDILSHYKQYGLLGSESMRSADDLEAKNIFISESEKKEMFASCKRSTTHFMDNKVNSYRSSSITSPNSSKDSYHSLGDMSPTHKRDEFDICHAEYGHQITSLENHMVQNACTSENVKREATEESIISDLLSLDLALDEPSLGANLGKLSLDDNDKAIFCSNVFTTGKSRNNNVSKFCFARVDESFSLGIDEHEHNVNLNKLEMVNNYSVCQAQPFDKLRVFDPVFSEGTASLCHCPNEQATNTKLHSSSHQSALPAPLPQVTPPPRCENKPLSFRPHDFFRQYNAHQDNSVSTVSVPASAAFSQHAGNSLHLSYSQQIAVDNGYTDTDHLCPSVTTFSHIPQSSSMDLLDYSSSEVDYRVSKWGINRKTQNSMNMVEGSKYNPQDLVRNNSGTSSTCKDVSPSGTYRNSNSVGVGRDYEW